MPAGIQAFARDFRSDSAQFFHWKTLSTVRGSGCGLLYYTNAIMTL